MYDKKGLFACTFSLVKMKIFISPLLFLLCISGVLSHHLYVVPFQTSSFFGDNDGSLLRPYSSIQQALDHIERNSLRTTTIHLYPTHYFTDTICLTQMHSHTRLTTMSMMYSDFYEDNALDTLSFQRLTKAVISGGMPITNWTPLGNNTFSATVPSLSYVNQLFINDQRIVRTRVPTNYSEYLHYAAPLNDSVMARYGFQYVEGQFNYKSLVDAMVVIYHSWTESHHYVDHLIPENNTIIFSNPSQRPIGSPMFIVQSQKRFHIENLCEALVPNSFCFVNETKTVYLMTNGSYNPNEVQVITPVHEIVVLLAGDSVYNPIEGIVVNNVAIQHAAWDLGRTQQADAAAAAFLRFGAFIVANASNIVVSDIEISHIGAYGLWINSGTEKVNFLNSLITDTGAGGIWIGRSLAPMPKAANSVKIISNEISYGGNVFPSGVGIVDGTSFDVIIASNTIHHQRYNGISIGSSLGYGPSGTRDILVEGNYIHNTGQHILCDQGGIYTVGVLHNTVIHGNVIKNVFSYSLLMWGIYLDEGTSQVIVSNNVVYNTGWASLFQHYGANNTIINNVFARASINTPPHPGDPQPDGDIRVQLAENHTSWIFTRNIVYDVSQKVNHTVYRPANGTITLFSDNVYFNPYGAQLLFDYNEISFVDWQKSGQDNNSVIADPLFAGDISQCDFFTVRSESPAVKLGFVNITKPSMWTPGCATDDVSNRDQFYHW